jgi:hypothetical protein
MIYSLEVSTFGFITKLNTLKWASRSSFKKNLKYLRATLFGLTKWPSLWLGVCVVATNDF